MPPKKRLKHEIVNEFEIQHLSEKNGNMVKEMPMHDSADVNGSSKFKELKVLFWSIFFKTGRAS